MASSTNPTILVVYLPNETLLVSTAETTSKGKKGEAVVPFPRRYKG